MIKFNLIKIMSVMSSFAAEMKLMLSEVTEPFNIDIVPADKHPEGIEHVIMTGNKYTGTAKVMNGRIRCDVSGSHKTTTRSVKKAAVWFQSVFNVFNWLNGLKFAFGELGVSVLEIVPANQQLLFQFTPTGSQHVMQIAFQLAGDRFAIMDYDDAPIEWVGDFTHAETVLYVRRQIARWSQDVGDSKS